MTIIILKEKLIKHLKEIKSLCIMKSLYMYGEDFTAIDRGKLLLIIIRRKKCVLSRLGLGSHV